ncbi:PACS1 family protein [Megaselia abdita]
MSTSKTDKMSSSGKPVPMKLFAAWEVDRTPPNCIPRLCSLTITKLAIQTALPSDMTSLSLAVKMQSSKRILRSHEIPLPQTGSTGTGTNILSSLYPSIHGNSGGSSGGGGGGVGGSPSVSGAGLNNSSIQTGCSNLSTAIDINSGGSTTTNHSTPLITTDLDLHFSLQYPHFIKRDGNRLVILLQRRKKYKSRTILGYKTLAEGVIRMDGILQKSMDINVELSSTGKNSNARSGTVIACIRAERVSSIPVDHDNKNNNNVLLADRVAEYSDEDEENEFSSGEENDDAIDLGGYTDRQKNNLRKYRSNQVDSDSEFEMKDKGLSRAKISRQRNFKQKIVALLKRFKVTDELEGGVSRGATALRNDRELDALFQELESLSVCENDDSGPDMDTLSVGSTPKPSLRPFFSSSKAVLNDTLGGTNERRSSNKSEPSSAYNSNNNNALMTTSPDRGGNDSSGNEGVYTDPEGHNSDPQNTNSPPREKDNQITTTPVTYTASSEKKSRLFRTSSSTPNTSKNKKQSLSLTGGEQQPSMKSVFDTCLSPTNFEPRKQLLEQLTKVFSHTEDICLPEIVTLITPLEALGTTNGNIITRLTNALTAQFRPAFQPQNTSEVKVILQALMNKIQKYCNSNAKPPATIKILLIGNDWLQGTTLRHYVDLLGVRPPDWVSHLRFYEVPIGTCTMSKYLASIDQSYQAMFGTENWNQLCERAAACINSMDNKSDVVEMCNRIQRYLHTAGPCTQIPIAEAMVNYKDEDSCQIFVPFISDVRIGYPDGTQISVDIDENNAMNILQSSPSVITGNMSNKELSSVLSGSPPHSGRISPPAPITPQQQSSFILREPTQESLELQIDYWPIFKHDLKEKGASKSADSKNSIKSAFRSLQVWRLPQNVHLGEPSNGLTLCFATKEKKQKQIMRLGKKKEKDRDTEKEQLIEGVARLICSPKQSHPTPMRVYIDGTEWTGVKFFQLSSQWQTHVKNFPVALIGCSQTE